MARNKKKWSELSRVQKSAIVGGGAIELITTGVALKDWARRPPAQMRGSKPLWLLLFVVQPIGPLAYLKFGRMTDTKAS